MPSARSDIRQPFEPEAIQQTSLANVACAQGRLGQAFRLATMALESAEEAGGGQLVDLDARLVLAEVLFERNELDASQAHLEAALHLCCSIGGTEPMWTVEVDLIRTMIAQLRSREALDRLNHLRNVAQAGCPNLLLPQRFNEVEVDCRLALGDLEGAALVARYSPSGEIPWESLARLDLCLGRPDRALSRLHGDETPSYAVHIRRLVLQARALIEQGCQERAEATMRRALDAARPEHYVRPFLEQAVQTLVLLEGVVGFRVDPYVSELVRQAEEVVHSNRPARADGMLEPLTEREWQVLRYLPSHLSQHQIGVLLFVTTNTVKTHVKNLYRKMGASSRDQAVSIARWYGLI
jgi:LuxR family maltose regulon positive regulatory protein